MNLNTKGKDNLTTDGCDNTNVSAIGNGIATNTSVTSTRNIFVEVSHNKRKVTMV